jgi:DNA-binding FrmR family transcriptional regulator
MAGSRFIQCHILEPLLGGLSGLMRRTVSRSFLGAGCALRSFGSLAPPGSRPGRRATSRAAGEGASEAASRLRPGRPRKRGSAPRASPPLANIPYPGILFFSMAHVIQHKKKLFARVSRIRGQINGIERALEENHDCGELLLTLAACRGALNSLMAEILEGHVRQHVLNDKSTESQVAAGDELIEVIKRYLK